MCPPDFAAAPSPEPATRRRGRPASHTGQAVPEDKVLDAAFRAFARRGYEGTTMRSLARQLGVSHNLLNVRFGSKADLWRRSIDACVARIAPPVFDAFDAPGLNDAERFDDLIHRFCLWAAHNPDFVSLTYAESMRASWRLDHLTNAYILPFKQRMEALLQGVAALRPVRDISAAAVLALLVQGVGFYFAATPLQTRIGATDQSAPGAIELQSRMFAEFILAGLIPAAIKS